MQKGWDGDPVSGFDQKLADAYVGRCILVGITYCDSDGNEIRKVQVHGEIESVTAEGLRIALHGSKEGEHLNLPPVYDAIAPAKPGRYSSSMTGEVIENPDFVTVWTVTEPVRS